MNFLRNRQAINIGRTLFRNVQDRSNFSVARRVKIKPGRSKKESRSVFSFLDGGLYDGKYIPQPNNANIQTEAPKTKINIENDIIYKINQDWTYIKNLKDDNFTEHIAMSVVTSDFNIIDFLPDKVLTHDVVYKFLTYFISGKQMKIDKVFSRVCPTMLDNRCWKYLIGKDWTFVDKIPEMTEELAKELTCINYMTIVFIPEKFQTDDVLISCFKNSKIEFVLNYVDTTLFTEKVWTYIVDKSCKHISLIPKDIEYSEEFVQQLLDDVGYYPSDNFYEEFVQLKNISADTYSKLVSKTLSSSNHKLKNSYLPGYTDEVYEKLVKKHTMFFKHIPQPTLNMYKIMYHNILTGSTIYEPKTSNVIDKFKYIFEEVLKDREINPEFIDYLMTTNLNAKMKKYVETFRPKLVTNTLRVFPDLKQDHDDIPDAQVVS